MSARAEAPPPVGMSRQTAELVSLPRDDNIGPFTNLDALLKVYIPAHHQRGVSQFVAAFDVLLGRPPVDETDITGQIHSEKTQQILTVVSPSGTRIEYVRQKESLLCLENGDKKLFVHLPQQGNTQHTQYGLLVGGVERMRIRSSIVEKPHPAYLLNMVRSALTS